jgi:hypothetical protein
VANGCFLQSHPAQPGERYAVRAVCRIQGTGSAWLRIRWQTAESRWTAEQRDRLIPCPGPRDQWSEMLGVVEVPDTAGRLVILLGIRGQRSPDDTVWYDNVEVIKLP